MMTSGFDTALPGTPEEAWHALLEQQPSWLPRGVPLIVVAPHPDDETLGAGGLIASYARCLRPVIVVSVTDGEASHPGWTGLRAIRRAELRRALALLSPHMILHTRLGLADGHVQRHEQSLRRHLLSLVRPGAMLVAPYERDGHCDHDAVGRVCRQVAEESGLRLARYPIWAWHQLDSNAMRGAIWGRYELSAEARLAKAAALKAFKSQIGPHMLQPIVPRHVLPYFTRPYEAFLL